MGVPKIKGGLAFQELDSFNLVLLAMQLWCILTKPTSLVATMVKEKYFKHSNVLEVCVKGNAFDVEEPYCRKREDQ